MKKKDVIAVLEAGRAAVAKRWTKGDYQNRGAVCAVGGLYKAIGLLEKGDVSHEQIALSSTAEELLQKALPVWEYSVTVYNDAEDTTKEDVLALYDRAIALAKRTPKRELVKL